MHEWTLITQRPVMATVWCCTPTDYSIQYVIHAVYTHSAVAGLGGISGAVPPTPLFIYLNCKQMTEEGCIPAHRIIPVNRGICIPPLTRPFKVYLVQSWVSTTDWHIRQWQRCQRISCTQGQGRITMRSRVRTPLEVFTELNLSLHKCLPARVGL